MSKINVPKNHLAITIDPVPALWILEEDQVRDKVIHSSPIFHSWMRKAGTGIIGVTFSSWMLNHSYLSKKEKEVVTEWNQSESDFEVFFGSEREYDSGADETVRNTCLVRLSPALLAIALPLYGTSLTKQEVTKLLEEVRPWARPPSAEDPNEENPAEDVA